MDQGQQKPNADQRLSVWAQRIAERRSSGTSVKSWCRENGVSEKTYYYWQKRINTPAREQQAPEFAAHERKRRSGSVKDVLPENVPVDVVEHRLSEEERICGECGTVMEEIGREVRRTLQIIPA